MKMLAAPVALALSLACVSAQAQDTQSPPVTPASVVAEASAEEWIAIPPEDVLIMELAPTAEGKGRYVVIQLMPKPFSQPWVENVRTLARKRWWDGLSVYRSVDNWVVQWGDVSEEKALPEGVVSPVESYEEWLPEDFDHAPNFGTLPESVFEMSDLQTGERRTDSGWFRFTDPYAPSAFYSHGWPIAFASGWQAFDCASDEPQEHCQTFERRLADYVAWPIHCYGSVGVARDIENTGTGSELYAVIGHAPRQLDRNIAVVGRVIEGMEHLSTLPRGTGEAGVYESREDDTPIVSVRLASDHPRGETFRYEYLDTASESFARYVHVRANRQDAFYTVPAGGVDICNVQVPVRLIEE